MLIVVAILGFLLIPTLLTLRYADKKLRREIIRYLEKDVTVFWTAEELAEATSHNESDVEGLLFSMNMQGKIHLPAEIQEGKPLCYRLATPEMGRV